MSSRNLEIAGITLFNRSQGEYVFTVEGRTFWACRSNMAGWKKWDFAALDDHKENGDFAHVTYLGCDAWITKQGIPASFDTLRALVLTVVDGNEGIPLMNVYETGKNKS